MNYWAFLVNHQQPLLIKLWEQIYLVVIATAVATMIGIPLGIIIAKRAHFKKYILGFANIVQTIPSLALLAFLLPFFGIGFTSAILALTIYALLPIVRNAMLGIEGVADEYIEAAQGLGFNHWQQLYFIELPLALPVMVGGIRTATAISVGIATLAAFIGAGGLGDFILQGIAMNDNRLVLLGAIPAAILALALDFMIAKIEMLLSRRRVSNRSKSLTFSVTTHSVAGNVQIWAKRGKQIPFFIALIAIAIFCISFFAHFYHTHRYANKNNTIIIATKNFTEQYILGELMAQMITQYTQLHVVKKFNLGATNIVQAALLRGEVDLYPEYTGTALLVVLHQPPITNPEKVYEIVKKQYQEKFNLVWLKPFGFENSQALSVKDSFAKKQHLQTISDLLPIQKQLIVGVPQEFRERADGYPGLIRYYGLHFGKVISMLPDLMYQAIRNDEVNVIMAFSTDGRIPLYHLTLLKDDKHFFPPYYAAPVIRESVLKAHPEIGKALALLANKIDAKAMQQMNYLVNEKHLTPKAVALQFLKAQ